MKPNVLSPAEIELSSVYIKPGTVCWGEISDSKRPMCISVAIFRDHLGVLKMSTASACAFMLGDTVSVSTNRHTPASYTVTLDDRGHLSLTLVHDQISTPSTAPETVEIDLSPSIRPRRDMQIEQAENAELVVRFFLSTGREILNRAEVINIAEQLKLVHELDWDSTDPLCLITALAECRKDWASEGYGFSMTTEGWRIVW